MANADTYADMVRVFDKKIAEIFKTYVEQYQDEEIEEEKRFEKKLDELLEKVNKIETILESGNFNINTSNNDDAIEVKKSSRRKKPKADEVFIPTIEKVNTTIKKTENNNKTIDNTNIFESLNALQNLKD